jgi:hypothetical protein
MEHLFENRCCLSFSKIQLVKFWQFAMCKMKKISNKFASFLFNDQYAKFIWTPYYECFLYSIIYKLDQYNFNLNCSVVLGQDLFINYLINNKYSSSMTKNNILNTLLIQIPDLSFNARSIYLAVLNGIDLNIINTIKNKLLSNDESFNINVIKTQHGTQYPLINVLKCSKNVADFNTMAQYLHYDPFMLDQDNLTPFYYLIIYSRDMMAFVSDHHSDYNTDYVIKILQNYEDHKFENTFNALYNSTTNKQFVFDMPGYMDTHTNNILKYITCKMILFIKKGLNPLKITSHFFNIKSIHIYRKLVKSLLFSKMLVDSHSLGYKYFSNLNLYDKNLSKIIMKLILH